MKKKLRKEGLDDTKEPMPGEGAGAGGVNDQWGAFEMYRARANKKNDDVDGLDDDNCAKMTGGSAEWKRMSRRVHGLD